MSIAPIIGAITRFVHCAYGTCVMRVLAWRHRALLAELRPVATRLEQEIGPRQKEYGAHFNALSLTDTGLALNDSPEDTALVADCRELAEALRKRGMHRIELDVQLRRVGQVGMACRRRPCCCSCTPTPT